MTNLQHTVYCIIGGSAPSLAEDLYETMKSGDVLIDNYCDSVEPAVVRDRLEALVESTQVKGYTAIITTHNPEVVNMFHNVVDGLHEDQLLIARGIDLQPVTEIFDPDWLSHFHLGDLYRNGTFK